MLNKDGLIADHAMRLRLAHTLQVLAEASST
jgi:hypothetical protein